MAVSALLLCVHLGMISLAAASPADINHVQLAPSQFSDILAKASRPFNGIILIQQQGEPIYQYIAGDDVNAQSQFMIASLSKTITASLILIAKDNGLLELDAPANRYLIDKDSTMYNLAPTASIADLLSHTSGLGAKKDTKEHSFHYSNEGYVLLGKILERVNKLPLSTQISQFAQTHQLAIQAHYGDYSHLLTTPNMVAGFSEHDGERKLLQSLTLSEDFLAAGSMQASAKSYSDFLYQLHTGKLVSTASYQAMISPHAKREHRWGELNYGFGVQISTLAHLNPLEKLDKQTQTSAIEVSHSGYLSGYMSLALYYPKQQLSVVILENTAWDLNDKNRVFGLHDAIRDAIRAQLNSDVHAI